MWQRHNVLSIMASCIAITTIRRGIITTITSASTGSVTNVVAFHHPVINHRWMATPTPTSSFHRYMNTGNTGNNNKDNNKKNTPIQTKFQWQLPMASTDIASISSSVTDNNDSNNNNKETEIVVEWSTEKVRSTFIDYFVSKQNHIYYPSSRCVPINDPTLLFTNAGMNQFKSIFLGQVDPQSTMSTLQRVVNSQKCIRAGGKHNDLDDVGRDTYHHTFFEMLGTWSFGNYFKQNAINFAWDILINVYQLDSSRIYATYFEGDPINNIPPDLEAKEYWLQYLPENRIIACNAKDNFWEMGDTGPCGPCTEIHYDRIGNGRDASFLVNADDPNVIEIWNIVFIQYNRQSATVLNNLPNKHIDTGMGLERLVSILQNKSSNYDIDCFQNIFHKIHSMTTVGPYTGLLGTDDSTLKDTAYRAIADHIRTLSFAIADGAVPSNEGRGYVLRRIFRRAARYGQQILNCPNNFFSLLVPTVIDTFGPTYPELVTAQETIIELLQEEEQSFNTMLQRGIKYFNEELSSSKIINGQQAFYLYDTLGFPIDLTELMAIENKQQVDINGFNDALNEQKQRSRIAQKASRNANSAINANISLELIAEQTAALAKNNIIPTDDSFKYANDNDSSTTVVKSNIVAIFDGTKFVPASTPIPCNQYVGIILDQTSFYAEAGGQEADYGTLDIIDSTTSNSILGTFTVTDVQVYGGYIVHMGMIVSSSDDDDIADDDDDNVDATTTITVGQIVQCNVNYNRRKLIAPNHSMTHILNSALRSVLGNKVDQRGSYCNTEKLRFDYSHKSALTVTELQQVESICQQSIIDELDVTTQYMPLVDALEINGVRAVFGEVYPDPVRVVTMGTDTSIEFCGGTHIQNTKESNAFVLIEETAVAKGIRRITAVTKDIAQTAIETGIQLSNTVSQLEEQLQVASTTTTTETTNSNSNDIEKLAGSIRKELDAAIISAPLKIQLRTRIETVQKSANDISKRIFQQKLDLYVQEIKEQVTTRIENDTTSPIILKLNSIGTDSKASQIIINTIKSIAPTLPFMGIAVADDSTDSDTDTSTKVFVFTSVPEDIIKNTNLKADIWIKETLQQWNGRGGGKPTNAQGQAQIQSLSLDIDTIVSVATKYSQEQLSQQQS